MPVFTGAPLRRTVSPLSVNIAPATGMVEYLYNARPVRRTVEVFAKLRPSTTALSVDRPIEAVGAVVLLKLNTAYECVGIIE